MEKWQEHPRRSGSTGRRSSPGDLTSVQFARVARQLGQVAGEHGLRAPSFRSPPRSGGLSRSIRRRADGSATVSVALRGRPAVAVVADMIDGILAANQPRSSDVAAIRDRLWSAAASLLSPPDQEPISKAGEVVKRAA